MIKGRGSQINTKNRFHKLNYEQAEGKSPNKKTEYLATNAKSLLNKVASPDIGSDWSINPYQGCEHGCVYCYARNTHPYWGYSAGIDFEQKILFKSNAPQLLSKKLASKNWKASPIMVSGNTDCYQPLEKKMKITRDLIKVFKRFYHPFGIITKNALIERDLDLLTEMAKSNLVKVSISITTLSEDLKSKLEPRTSSIKKRFEIVNKLSSSGIPVNVMIAPVIPSLTDHELLPIAKQASEMGANSIAYTLIRLNADVAEIFEDWSKKAFPDRASKILNAIRSCRSGKLGESEFGKRMRGEGKRAQMIKDQYKLAVNKYFSDRSMPEFNLELYEQYKNPQLKLF